MPQKKNPDVPELVRGKTGRVNGHLVALLTLMKGQPLAYNKDNQEDKEPLFDTVDTLTRHAAGLHRHARRASASTRTRCGGPPRKGFATATDLADYLVKKGLPFRDAHEAVARAVRFAAEQGEDLADVALDGSAAFLAADRARTSTACSRWRDRSPRAIISAAPRRRRCARRSRGRAASWAADADALGGSGRLHRHRYRFSIPGHRMHRGRRRLHQPGLSSAGALRLLRQDQRRGCRAMFDAEAEGLRAIARPARCACPSPCAPASTRAIAGWCWNTWSSCPAAREPWRCSANGLRPASLERRTLRLASRQHHRRHAAAERGGRRLDRVLARQRLGFQLELAARNGYGGALQRRGELLLARLDGLLAA